AKREQGGLKVGSDNLRIMHINGEEKIVFVPRCSKEDFTKFFSDLSNEKNPPALKDIANKVLNQNIDEMKVAYYKPVIRLPWSETFYVNDIDDQLARISRVTMSV